ncbi:MAG TPA: carboxypeptidase regulatory-like domain-containing protein [Caldisericia bacterium]|nr:carboxypeptidase regulatory-like domain-containing protein [Caldisericia bacterium]HXK51090.1 carboxypeptidase regulatory-like domain-containing protein [Caldisericia bacterium]
MKKIRKTLSLLLFGLMLATFAAGCGNSDITKSLKANEAKIIGIITNVETQLPVDKVKIVLKSTNTDKQYKTSTNSSGQYAIICEPGYYSFQAEKEGYTQYSKNVVLGKGENEESFYLGPVVESLCEFEGRVIDHVTQKIIPGASVQAGRNLTHADAEGNFKFEKKLPEGSYDCFVSAPGFELLKKTIQLTKGKNRAQFELNPFDPSSSSPTQNNTDADQTLQRNPITAIDPSFINDYKVSIKKVLRPTNEVFEYEVIVQDRYTSYLYSKEPDFEGQILVSNDGCYEKVNDQDWIQFQQSEIMMPQDVFKEDVESLLFFFGFADPNVVIEEIGEEAIGLYPCKKYHIYTKDDAPEEQQFDFTTWVIKDTSMPSQLMNCLIRMKGTVPKNPDGIWYDIDITFSNIGNGNKIPTPSNLPAKKE